MLYSIYHPVGGAVNHDCKCGLYMYEHVYTIECDGMSEAFRLSQNDNDEYAALGVHSPSGVVEVIEDARWELVKKMIS